jgi:hypothetical protein
MQTTTTHPAVAIRHAVEAVTTELVRADIEPGALFVYGIREPFRMAPSVSLNLGSRADFDACASLLSFGETRTYGDPRRIQAEGQILGYSVSATAPEEDPTP